MSGIYITGMEMPKSCWDCPCSDKSNGVCEVIVGGAPIWDDRPAWCPLVSVQPHGRLIDANAMYEKFVLLENEAMGVLQNTSIGSVDGIKWTAILTERTGYKFDIENAPTIIPAEEVIH